jgi:predicted MPP superfamily phosphohydrolase
MSKITIIEGNSNDKDNVRVIMVKGEKGEQGDLNHSHIVDNLNSTDNTKVLSAKQGKVLKDLVDTNTENIETNATNISTNTTNISTNTTNISNEMSARQNADDNLQSQINVERGRIDNIATLPSGSTSGDAELIDIRTGFNSESYSSAGNSVRGQLEYVNKKIDNLNDISGIYSNIGVLANGSVGNPGNPNAVNTSNYFKTTFNEIVNVSIKRPVSQEGNFYCFSYSLYDINKTVVKTYDWDASRTSPFYAYSSDHREDIVYIRIAIWEYNPTTEQLVPLRKADFEPNDVYIEIVNNLKTKLDKRMLEWQLYFDKTSNQIFETKYSMLYFYFTEGIRTRGGFPFTGDRTLAQIGEEVGSEYVETSPSGIPGCIRIPNLYNLVIDLETRSYAIISRNTTNANRYIELLCNVEGVVVKGLFKSQYDKYMLDIKMNNIPNYWDNNLLQAINSVRTNLANSNGEFSNMFFITDQHWEGNAKKSSNLIKYLGKKLNISLVLSGGDVNSSDYNSKLEPIGYEQDYVSSLQDGYLEIFCTYGNHDFNYNSASANPDYALSQNQVYESMIKQINQSNKVNTRNKDVMYYDNENEHLRVINFKCYQDNHNPQVDNNIKTAITDLVNELDNSWSIVFFCHSYWGVNLTPFNVGADYAQHIASLAHTASANILCMLVGHTHKDMNAVVTASNGGKLQIIGTRTDSIGSYRASPKDNYTMTSGTDTEQAFDIVQIDKTNRKIYMTRVGAGLSREFTI